MHDISVCEINTTQLKTYDLVAWRWLLRCETARRWGRRRTCMQCYGRARDLLAAGGMWAVPACVVGVDVVLADQITGAIETVKVRTDAGVLSLVHVLHRARCRGLDDQALSLGYDAEALAHGVPFGRPGAAMVERVAAARARWESDGDPLAAAMWEPAAA